jgi:hypothetical protein
MERAGVTRARREGSVLSSTTGTEIDARVISLVSMIWLISRFGLGVIEMKAVGKTRFTRKSRVDVKGTSGMGPCVAMQPYLV